MHFKKNSITLKTTILWIFFVWLVILTFSIYLNYALSFKLVIERIDRERLEPYLVLLPLENGQQKIWVGWHQNYHY